MKKRCLSLKICKFSKLKNILPLFLLGSMFFLPTAIPVYGRTVDVTTLGADGTDSKNDKAYIQAALNTTVKKGDSLIVYIPDGTYYINGPLYVHSNTTIRMSKKARIKRNTAGLKHNMLKNADAKNQTLTMGEYNLSSNITLEGGTWDGGAVDTVGFSSNLINLGHATNIVIKNTTVKNCMGAHLIELAGVKNATITNCKFSGFAYDDSLAESEAIQLDVCHTTSEGKSWNPAFLSDDTYCQNITISNNTFTDYPRGIGNHHDVPGKHSRNVTITNNTFKNTTSLRNYALNLVGFDNTVVKNNKINGFKWGVRAYNCKNMTIQNNSISDSSEVGISISNATFKNITGNQIKTVKRHGILINGTSSVVNLSSNTVSKAGRNGIMLEDAVTVENLNNNTITSVGLKDLMNGISLYGKKTYVKNVRGNKITDSSQCGIMIANDARAGVIASNKISNTKYIGICINSPKKTSITSNTLTDIKSAAIYLVGSTKATLKKNKVKNITYFKCIHSEYNKIKESSIRGYITKVKKKYVIKIYTKNRKKLTAAIGKKKYKVKKAKKKQLLKSEKKLTSGETIYIVEIPKSKKNKTLTLTLTDKSQNTLTRKFKVNTLRYMS